MSPRRLQDMSSRHLFKTFSRRLQRNNFLSSKTSLWRLERRKLVTLKTCWRRLEDQQISAGIGITCGMWNDLSWSASRTLKFRSSGSKFQVIKLNLTGAWWSCNLQTAFAVVASWHFWILPTSSSGLLPVYRAYFKAFLCPFLLIMVPVKRRVAKTKD